MSNSNIKILKILHQCDPLAFCVRGVLPLAWEAGYVVGLCAALDVKHSP